jgi:hypothetical protein
LYDPTNSRARGLLGQIAYRGKWQRPEAVSRALSDDEVNKARIKEYLERRAKAPDRAEDQWKLALWCEQNDLKQQATAHLYRVLQLDPSREAAWKRLGFKRLSGRWDKPERVAAAKAEAQEQHKANNRWKPILDKIVSGLTSKDKARNAQAEKAVTAVYDPRAVPAIWMTFANGGPQHQKLAVRLLGQIDSPGSSRALALLAVMSRSAEVRRNATQILRQRDPRDFASVLIVLLRDPIKYDVRPVNGPGSRGELVVNQKNANVKRLYSPPAPPTVPLLPGDQVALDGNGLPVISRELGVYNSGSVSLGRISDAAAAAMFGLPTAGAPAALAGVLNQAGIPAAINQKLASNAVRNSNLSAINLGGDPRAPVNASPIMNRELEIPIGQMMLEAQMSALLAQQQLAGDVQAIEAYNAPILASNAQVRQVLTDSIGTDLGPDRANWEKWLVDLAGYALAAPRSYEEKPTYVEEVPLAYQPQTAPLIVDQPIAIQLERQHHSCFGAGTPVRTLDGLAEIQKLRAGDIVLTQGSKTGELTYQPVVAVYHNPPNATLRIELDKEAIVATGIHRFWKAGRGWVMARELKPGDSVRTLGGVAVVKSIDAERTQSVYNLQVADGQSFFVGAAGVLAHDNSLVSPTPNPFDAVPDLAKTAMP